MASKSLSKDLGYLYKILEHQNNIKQLLKDFNVSLKTDSKNFIGNNKYARDLAALYIAQIGEAVGYLTDDSKKELRQVFSVEMIKYFRNKIYHTYEKVNPLYLAPYIDTAVSKNAIDIVKKRIEYCNANKRV